MSLRIALAQINPTVGDLNGNHRLILDYVRLAKQQQADLIVFPELVVTGYPPEDLLHKDHFVWDNIKILKDLAKHIKGMSAVIGFVDRDRNNDLFNAAALIENGKIKNIYHKQALPNYGVFDEKRYFTPGRAGQVFRVKGCGIGISICEDIWVDRGIYTSQAKKGARILINLSSSPYDLTKLKAREKLLKARAKQTNTFVCYTNLVGGQDELVFDGGSLAVDPRGKIMASGKLFEEDLICVDFPVGRDGTRGEKAKALLKSRKAERISQVEQVYQALVLGTRDYVKKNGFNKVVIGLSGGIDSALVAAVAVDAIGADNVVGVTMPSRFTSRATKSDAKQLAEYLGIECMEILIEKVFKSYLDILADPFNGAKPNIAEENIQARIRGNILMALSNKFGWLVLTTGNKSEVAVGYCTLYGDMSGGFAVIKDVPKTQVYALAEFRNTSGQTVIPRSIITRAPTAELRKNQKDQDSLPPYNILDTILESYVEKHYSLKQIAKHHPSALVADIAAKVDRNEYKRRQAPPGIKITPRAFGKDRRMPMTNKYKEIY